MTKKKQKLWGYHCLSEWCCPNNVENMFCICARNLDNTLERCPHDTRTKFRKERKKILDVILKMLDDSYWIEDTRPNVSADYEEGACEALKNAYHKVEAIQKGKS